MNSPARGILLLLVAELGLVSGARGSAEASPHRFPEPTWLSTHQRLCFAVDEKNLDEVIRDGANVICGGTNAAGIGFAGGPFILSKDERVIDIRSGTPIPEGTLKEIRARVDAAHARGAKVLGEVIRFYMTPWMQAEHPDWQEITSPGGKPISVDQLQSDAVLGCWNSPYGEWFIHSQRELVRRLDWDGYNMDGLGCWTHCFCPACRAAYRADAGKEIPLSGDVNDREFRRWLKWKLDRYSHFIERWTRALKEIKPDFVAAPWSTGPGRWWHWMGAPAAEGSDLMHRALDAPFLELFWDFPPDQGSNLLPAFTCRYYRGLAGDRPAWILPYLCEQGQFNMQPPAAECDLREMTVLTNGCLAAQGFWQQSRDAPLSRFNKLLRDREPFTRGARSLKWAAMLVGESSRLLYGLPGVRSEVPLGAWMGSGVDSPSLGPTLPGERRMPAHMESAAGVFRAMMEDHLPLDIIIDEDVESPATLGQYRVLILPDAACLSGRAVEAVSAFVRGGGGLVAMHESSLCDELGDRREDFGLASVFGAHFKKTEDYSARWPNYPRWTEIYLGIAGPDLHPIYDDPVVRSNYRRGSDRLQYIGWMTDVEPASGAAKLGRRLTTPPEWPFLILNTVGQGRSAYFACDIGQAYFIAPYQYQRRLISNAVRWAAEAHPPPIAVKAPLCVQAAFYTQDQGKRTIVHLLNEVNTGADRAIPENNPSEREEVLPIADITVSLARPDVTRAFQEPEHRELAIMKTAAGVEVTVPRLETHSMVVFE